MTNDVDEIVRRLRDGDDLDHWYLRNCAAVVIERLKAERDEWEIRWQRECMHKVAAEACAKAAEAAEKHLDAACQSIGLPPTSSEPLVSAIERLKVERDNYLNAYKEVVSERCDAEARAEAAEAQNAALVKALDEARGFLDPDCSPPRKSNREMVTEIDAALSSLRAEQR